MFEKLVRDNNGVVVALNPQNPCPPNPVAMLTLLIQNMEKVLPDSPVGKVPVHLRKKQIYAHYPILRDQQPFIPPAKGEAPPS